MPMSPRLLRPRASGDPDAGRYIAAVQAADGQALEPAVRQAIEAFVRGCKRDGIWSSIKASCILMGARTLSGALTPLVGTAPTNNNFVSGDYNRKTGLVGNGTNKFINANRAGNIDPQNSFHTAVYRTDTASVGTSSFFGSEQPNGDRNVTCYSLGTSLFFAARKNSIADSEIALRATAAGFVGVARSSSTVQTQRAAGSATTSNPASIAPGGSPTFIFGNSFNGGLATPTAARFAFYSIGESLALSSLDSRVSTLYTAIGAAIP